MEKLEKKLAAMEKGSIHSELATGVFVCSAQAFLRLGLATTILTGGALFAAGELSFLYFLGFLFAAARLYDPLGLVLQNIAATFNTKLQIERMRSILEQPIQEGTKEFAPENYNITFDHVSFAYREGDGVLEDVSFYRQTGRSNCPDRSLRRRKVHRMQTGRPLLGRYQRENYSWGRGRVRCGSRDTVNILLYGFPGCSAVSGTR